MPARNKSLYQKAVEITEEYLGPAGERFIRRQITTHLHIKPEELDKNNLSKLVDWSSIAFSSITDKDEDVRSFKQALSSLTNNYG